MRKKRFIGSMGATLVLVAASLGEATPSFAQDGQDATVEDLAELNPGTSEAQLLAEADGLAEQLGTTPEAILAQHLTEAEESAAAASGLVSAKSSSGGSGTVTLGSATRKGDTFVSPASTLFVEHGTAVRPGSAARIKRPATAATSSPTPPAPQPTPPSVLSGPPAPSRTTAPPAPSRPTTAAP